ncbi:hypothetical protein [Tenacibaculum aiptasiae]|uniref:hypothetical protein n=1 Tax=Tenacibaculum aiptasiae TaxID=426481 RepID=UPI003B5AFBF7
MNTYIIIPIIALLTIVVLINDNSKRNLTKLKEAENISEIRQEKRDLKLTFSYNYGEKTETISEKATVELIKSTMNSINWNKFHIVQLEDENGKNYKALHVSGSLKDDGLTSGFVTDDNHILIDKQIKTVEQMTEILIDFLKGENIWRNKYEYK